MVIKFSDIIGQASQGPITTAAFIPQGTTPPYATGLMWYDPNDSTMRYYNDSTSGDSIAIGFETNVRIRNTSGATIVAGQVLRVTGGSGSRPTVALAQANVFGTAKVFAIATETIANNSNGYATISGVIKNINLSAYTVGDELYLSPTVAGGMTNVRPSSPNFAQPLGSVSDASVNGRMIVDFGGRRAIGYGTANQMLGMKADGSAPEYKTPLQSRTAILPAMTGNAGRVLGTDGTDISWVTQTGGGGGGAPTPVAVTTATTMATNTIYQTNTTGGPVTLTIPAGTDAFVATVLDAVGAAGATNLIRISPPTGQSVDTFPVNDSITLTYPYANVRLSRVAGSTVTRAEYQVGSVVDQTKIVALGDDVIYTPVFDAGFGTVTNVNFAYRRVGAKIHISGRFQTGSNPSAGPARIFLPAGLTVGQIAGNNSGSFVVGKWVRDNASASAVKQGTVIVNSAFGQSFFSLSYDDYTLGSAPLAPITSVSGQIGASQFICLDGEIVIPVAEWAGSGTIAFGVQTQQEFAADDGTNDVFGLSGAAMPAITLGQGAVSRNFAFQTASTANDFFVLEIQMSGASTTAWIPSDTRIPWVRSGANDYYGMCFEAGANGTYTVFFGARGTEASAGFGVNGLPWTNVSRYRLRKANPIVPSGVVQATPVSDGMVKKPRYQIKYLGANLTGNNAIALSFVNITVGKLYRITLVVGAVRGTADGKALLTISHNGASIGYAGLDDDATITSPTTRSLGHTAVITFVAVTAGVSMISVIAGTGSTILGAGSATPTTYAILEELNHYEATTDWT